MGRRDPRGGAPTRPGGSPKTAGAGRDGRHRVRTPWTTAWSSRSRSSAVRTCGERWSGCSRWPVALEDGETYEGLRLVGQSLAGSRLRAADLRDCHFTDCDLSNGEWERCRLDE